MRAYSNGWWTANPQNAPGLIITGAKTVGDLKPDINIIDALRPYSKILDFGCGIGRNTFALNADGHAVTAFDFPNMIQMMMSDPRYATRITVETDWHRLVEVKFDAILASLVLQHLPADVADEYLAAMAKMTGHLLVHSRAYMDYGGGQVIDAVSKHFSLDAMENTREQEDQAKSAQGEAHFTAWFCPRLEQA